MELVDPRSWTTVFDRIGSLGLVPVVEVEDPTRAAELAKVLVACGLPCAEVTFRTKAAAESIGAIHDAVPELLLGAGTVLSEDQAKSARDAGASFLVSPGSNPRVINAAKRMGIPLVPGVCTPTEIEASLSEGLSVLKFFPAEASGGPAFLKSVAGPYPEVRFIPTGGISAANLSKYLDVSNVLACGGSWMVRRELIAAGDFATIRQLVSDAVALVATVRQPGGP
ncbi:MAG: bifunctional 4-hydroxy-2-oxoglutarate aldolase/2-dehydro-3-deoxy-phosphogluconate aldolase [Isosphaeraceae bacterium]